MTTVRDSMGLVGTVVAHQYRVDRVVAEGGFGVVFQGTHLALDRPVALKVLRPPQSIEPNAFADALDTFLAEAKTLAKLEHPAIVRVFDGGIAHGPSGDPIGWMALEWLPGETLAADLAKRRGRGGRTVKESLELLRPIFEAMAAAHVAGVVHRDLKPSNIMIVDGASGRTARVLDFGIAKIMDPGEAALPSGATETRSQSVSFTRVSAAPEQLTGMRTGPWTDVFALGLLFTELVTDRGPFEAASPTEHMQRLFAAERPTPAALGVDVGGAETVLARALAVEPAERYPNAGELLGALEQSLADTFSPLRHTAAPERPGRRRWPLLVGVAAVTALAAVGGAIRMRSATRSSPSTASSAPTPDAARCTTNRACAEAKGGAPTICRKDTGACVPLASVDCEVDADPRALGSDETIFFGSMFPTTGPDAASFGNAHARAVDLARRDFDEIMLGTALQSGGDSARPIGLISCDDAVDPRRALSHLVDEIGVSAVIGFRSGGEHIDLATTKLLPAGVLSLDATSTNPLVTHVPRPAGSPNLVFRTTNESTSSAAAIAAFLERAIEPELGGAPLRVTLLRNKSALGSAFAEALSKRLRLGGKSVVDAGAAFQDVSYELESTSAPNRYAATVDRIVAQRPDVVVFMGSRPAVQGVLGPLDVRWGKGGPKPRIVSMSMISPDLLEYVGKDPARRRRVFGVSPVARTPANLRFVAHFNETFADAHVTPTFAPNPAYDAFYLLAFASYAVPANRPLTGAALASAFGRLVPEAPPLEVGLNGIFDAYAALSSGKSIDVVGATGPLDFDLATGESAFDQAILCVQAGADGKAEDGVESGLVYLAKDGRLAGTMTCH